MNRILLAGIGLALTTAASAGIAQGSPQGAAARTWAQGAPTVTRDDVANRVRTMFARLDANRDGALTREEARIGAQGLRGRFAGREGRPALDPAQRAARRGQAFDRLDRDRNGVITRDEFATVQGMRREDMGMHGQRMGGRHGGGMGGRMFAMADLDRDGRVTLREATDSALRRFDINDRNRDGRITPEERQLGRGQMGRRG
jgi:Ca2+-binding EF-hand superfamily protein